MTRNLKALGLVLTVALALVGVVTSAASAEDFIFTSEAEDTVLKGEQIGTSKMVVDGGTVSCSSATFEGTISSPLKAAVEAPLTGTYKGCIAFGFAEAEIDMNSCSYVVTPATKEGSTYNAKMTIDCEEENDSITVVVKSAGVTKCTVHVGEQQTLGNITVPQEGSPSAIRGNLSLTGIEYDQTAGSGLGACLTAENTTNGSYEGVVLIKGYAGETQLNLKDEPIPKNVEISPSPVKMPGLGKTEKFKITNITGAQLTVIGVIIPGKFVEPLKKCWGKPIEKKGDKADFCEEELKCVKLSKQKLEMAVLASLPLGGAKAKVENC